MDDFWYDFYVKEGIKNSISDMLCNFHFLDKNVKFLKLAKVRAIAKN